MGKILRREGGDTNVVETFYRSVVQAVLLFGLESWVLSISMEKTVEGTPTGYLQ